MTAPVAFRQSDLTRALKATKAAGFDAARIELEPGGKIVILAGGPDARITPAGEPNEWDEVYEDAPQGTPA
jgi:hypothetical protein